MRKIDLAISSNGRTLLELAYFQLPTLSIPENDRELVHTFAKIENGIVFNQSNSIYRIFHRIKVSYILKI